MVRPAVMPSRLEITTPSGSSSRRWTKRATPTTPSPSSPSTGLIRRPARISLNTLRGTGRACDTSRQKTCRAPGKKANSAFRTTKAASISASSMDSSSTASPAGRSTTSSTRADGLRAVGMSYRSARLSPPRGRRRCTRRYLAGNSRGTRSSARVRSRRWTTATRCGTNDVCIARLRRTRSRMTAARCTRICQCTGHPPG